ncbi:MAG: hypothetical protein CVU18_11360 [Betaproteobacteria bacterium HGW-Betaproteobacteria-12]|nr:MAG: hypothetical protein CVU18_11360 [Betaproteobacteria bacterium HGW-Betaproteobacteria-12]
MQLPDIDSQRPKPMLAAKLAAFERPRDPTTALTKAIAYYEAQLIESPQDAQTLVLLADTTLISLLPQRGAAILETLVQFLTGHLTLTTLDAWAEHYQEAAELFSLSKSLGRCRRNPDAIALSPALSAREHFRTHLESCYLLALLTEQLPRQTDDPTGWQHKLRVWLLLHAYSRSNRGVRLDDNLSDLSRYLRMGSARASEWQLFFARLQSSQQIETFRQFNAGIARRAEKEISNTEPNRKFWNACRALQDVANNRDKISKEFGLPDLLHIGSRIDLATHHIALEQKIEIDDIHAEINFSTRDDVKCIITTPEPGSTPGVRRISPKTVLLANTEAQQFLPWSWGRPNPTEALLIERWVLRSTSEAAPNSRLALSAALLWAALSLGRRASLVLAIPIESSAGDEWSFDSLTGDFIRIPPMRKPGWLPNAESSKWIYQSAEMIRLSPPSQVAKILQLACQNNPMALHLGDLRLAGEAGNPELWIRTALKEIAPRLQPSMLDQLLPQRIFELTRDAVLARLLASHPQTALSGAHSYAQWTLSTVTELLNGKPPRQSDETQLIALGSRLAIVEKLLRTAVNQATLAVLHARDSGDAVRFHNAYTAYAVAALLAATGGRAIRSPFQSIQHFDFDSQFVFVDDKHGGIQQRSGRPIPIPSSLSSFIRNRYLPHLQALAATIKPLEPELAEEIALSCAGRPSGRLPLFFFLDRESLSWNEVTPITLFQTAALYWPLPANLFRHRLANRLRTEQLDPEIIDGLLGHAEWGNETWGRHSFRCWQQDAAEARPALSHALRSLRFRPLRGLSTRIPAKIRPPCKLGTLPSAPLFGSMYRKQERRRRFISIIRDTKLAIEEFLQGRQLDSLDSLEIDRLAEILTQRAGVPIATGGIRLAFLYRQLERSERKGCRTPRPTKERLIVTDTPSIFSEDCAGAITLAQTLRRLLPVAGNKARGGELLLAMTHLALESRIADMNVLSGIAANRDYRLVRIGDNLFLEFGAQINKGLFPGRRYRISQECALLLQRTSKARSHSGEGALPGCLVGIAELLPGKPTSSSTYISALARVVSQVNALTLPAVVGSVLAGKLETAALGWHDIVRLQYGRRIELSGDNSLQAEREELSSRIKVSTSNVTADVMAQSTRKLLSGIRKALRNDAAAMPGTPNRRRTLCQHMERAIQEGLRAGASQASLLLCQWLLTLARRSNGKALNTRTLQRYFVALAWRVSAEFSQLDLLRADDEDLTEAYTRLLLSDEKPAGEYELLRLAAFHQWLRKNYDIAEPDWSELPVACPYLGISPGLIRPTEYQGAIEILLASPTLPPPQQITAAMVLLLAYRFGLRKNEALFLTREDIQPHGDRLVVTIKNNRWRQLKTLSSRRQVPLVFNLNDQEQALIANALLLYDSRRGGDGTQLLFSVDDHFQAVSAISSALKEATGNASTTLHHARHSAANFVALNTLDIAPGAWQALKMESDANTCLLGNVGSISRRSGWAIARFLGHGSPTTTIRSYLHFIFDWAGSLTDITPTGSSTMATLDEIHRLDTLPEASPVVVDLKPTPPAKPVTVCTILQAFRLHARQFQARTIAAGLGVEERHVGEWLALLSREGKQTGYGEIVGDLADSTWDRLIEWARSLPTTNKQPAAVPSVGDLREMLGLTKQLLAWREPHFEALRAAIDYFGISKEQFHLFAVARASSSTVALCRHYDFELSERPRAKAKANRPAALLQIDSGFAEPHLDFVGSRVALVLEEDASTPIRNRHQLALLMASLGLALASS